VGPRCQALFNFNRVRGIAEEGVGAPSDANLCTGRPGLDG
jgi:hypothetical protein